jgi:hypothetical protein
MAGDRATTGGRIARILVGAVIAVLVTTVVTPAWGPRRADAGGPRILVECPRRVGGQVNRASDIGIGETSRQCFYTQRRPRDGTVRLAVNWRSDAPESRRRCVSRDPEPLDGGAGGPEDFNRTLHDPTAAVTGTYHVTEGRRVSREAAEAALRSMMDDAARLAHPCVPTVDVAREGAELLDCPLVIGDWYVRADWYGDPAPAMEAAGDPADRRFQITCRYWYAYQDEGDSVSLRVDWLERGTDDPLATSYCRAERSDDGTTTRITGGVAPVLARGSSELLAAGGTEVLDALVAIAIAQVPRCGSGTPDTPDTADTPVRWTSIILSGGPGDPRPSVGGVVVFDEDDRYGVVVGGPDGVVLRDEYLGVGGTIVAIGGIAIAEDGTWSIIATIDLDAPPAPDPSAAGASPPVPSPRSPGESATPAPATPAPTTPIPTPSPATPRPVGPAAAAIVEAIAAQVDALGRQVAERGAGSTRISAALLGGLVALAPDVATSIRPAAGTIVVTTELGEVLVTPDIGADGLVEFHLSRFAWATTLPVVQRLVASLNAGVVARGARFRMVGVTPDGVELVAERRDPP